MKTYQSNGFIQMLAFNFYLRFIIHSNVSVMYSPSQYNNLGTAVVNLHLKEMINRLTAKPVVEAFGNAPVISRLADNVLKHFDIRAHYVQGKMPLIKGILYFCFHVRNPAEASQNINKSIDCKA